MYGVTANHPHESEYSQARQFFYILSGQATMRLADGEEVLNVGDGIEIAPMEAHQMINASCGEIEFIVASAPKSHGDKVLVH